MGSMQGKSYMHDLLKLMFGRHQSIVQRRHPAPFGIFDYLVQELLESHGWDPNAQGNLP